VKEKVLLPEVNCGVDSSFKQALTNKANITASIDFKMFFMIAYNFTSVILAVLKFTVIL
jgi:hypothetical protein